mmetsp:Transcript_32887/g.93477  ORF Transcript_32887/g.93477 Transcript_32887/m.93477 type:complete len:260 (-) Transcript_32887:12-791(-)
MGEGRGYEDAEQHEEGARARPLHKGPHRRLAAAVQPGAGRRRGEEDRVPTGAEGARGPGGRGDGGAGATECGAGADTRGEHSEARGGAAREERGLLHEDPRFEDGAGLEASGAGRGRAAGEGEEQGGEDAGRRVPRRAGARRLQDPCPTRGEHPAEGEGARPQVRRHRAGKKVPRGPGGYRDGCEAAPEAAAREGGCAKARRARVAAQAADGAPRGGAGGQDQAAGYGEEQAGAGAHCSGCGEDEGRREPCRGRRRDLS